MHSREKEGRGQQPQYVDPVVRRLYTNGQPDAQPSTQIATVTGAPDWMGAARQPSATATGLCGEAKRTAPHMQACTAAPPWHTGRMQAPSKAPAGHRTPERPVLAVNMTARPRAPCSRPNKLQSNPHAAQPLMRPPPGWR